MIDCQFILRFYLPGESGIRTHGDISATLDFESSALDQLSHLSLCAVRGVLCLFLLLVSRFIWLADTGMSNKMSECNILGLWEAVYKW